MKNLKIKSVAIFLMAFSSLLLAAEMPTYRLLSVSESEKLILISQIPTKAKFLLDAASAKITVNGKPAEFRALKAFSHVQVKANFSKTDKLGIEIDGTALEIRISTENKSD